MASGITDTGEIYDDPMYSSFFEDYLRPPPCMNKKIGTERFCRKLHETVLEWLLVLTAIIMEMADEKALSTFHRFNAKSDSRMRYIIQHPRSDEEIKVLEQAEDGDGDIIHRHTDFGTYTLLFSQPIAALQLWDKDNKWKWVKPVPGSIIANVGETLEFLTGGYLRTPTHRVAVPPPDQRYTPRLSVIYFSRPDDETKLEPLDGPVVLRENSKSRFTPPSNCRTVGDWSRDIKWVIGYDYS
ncbi:Clavaminate synthase-like protein [Cadophora sp. DSE1049]|nr:Clavaminate synthase-like protein [Cadophora sp. DSE1049]